MSLRKTLIGSQIDITDNLSDVDIDKAYELLIEAYAKTEVEIWGENYTRIEAKEFSELALNKAIIVAKFQNKVVGVIHYYQIDQHTASFGLLAVDFEYKGHGIGRKLIQTVESKALLDGIKLMKIEVLRPSNFIVEFKTQLNEWYKRLGYHYTRSVPFLSHKPDKIEKAKSLITEASFDCFEKSIQ